MSILSQEEARLDFPRPSHSLTEPWEVLFFRCQRPGLHLNMLILRKIQKMHFDLRPISIIAIGMPGYVAVVLQVGEYHLCIRTAGIW